MKIFAGTSGFSFAAWKGRFYPAGLPDAQMLGFYSERLPSVEINNSFYQLPKPETMAGWRDGAPESFLFAVKATRRITHQKKLVDVGADVAHLFSVVDVLGEKRGPVLFQLPPFLKKDSGVLDAFLAVLPEGRRVALEFRHPSWFVDEVYAALATRNVALVGGDLDESEKSPPLVATADFGYLRLRRMDYDPASIGEWSVRVRAQSWHSVHAYFKHEVLGPMFAEALLSLLSGREMADLSLIRASIAAPKPKSARSAAVSPSKAREPPATKPPSGKLAKTSQTVAASLSKAPTRPAIKSVTPSSRTPSKPRKP